MSYGWVDSVSHMWLLVGDEMIATFDMSNVYMYVYGCSCAVCVLVFSVCPSCVHDWEYLFHLPSGKMVFIHVLCSGYVLHTYMCRHVYFYFIHRTSHAHVWVYRLGVQLAFAKETARSAL